MSIPAGREREPYSHKRSELLPSHIYRQRLPLHDATGTEVGTRTKFVVFKQPTVTPTDLVPVSEPKTRQLQVTAAAYLDICDTFGSQDRLGSVAFHRARNSRDDTRPVILPNGQVVEVINSRLGQVYTRESEDSYEYVLDLASSPHAFRGDPDFLNRTFHDVPSQSLPLFGISDDPNPYRMMNINPFTLVLPTGETINGILFRRFHARDEQRIPDKYKVFVQLLVNEGFFPIDLVGFPFVTFPDNQ